MTTITFKDGILAADTYISNSASRVGTMGKLFRFRTDGKKTQYTAIIGNAAECIAMSDWILNGRDPKKTPDLKSWDFQVIHFKDGEVKLYQNGLYPIEYTPVNENFDAWGSGADYALGAMENGASAIEAIKIASKYDLGTGGVIDTYKID